MRIALWIAAVLCAATAPSRADLVGYWSFDEGAGQVVADGSGNGNHGVLGGSVAVEATDPTWTTRPGGGSALTFDDSNDVVLVPDSSVFDLGSDGFNGDAITISAWIKLNPGSTGPGAIVVKGPPDGGASNLPGTLHFNVQGDDTLRFIWTRPPSVNHSLVDSTSTVPEGEWVHVLVTLQESVSAVEANGLTEVVIYINGVVAGSGTHAGGFGDFGDINAEPLLIGNRKDNAVPFAGSIDDVAIWSHVLHPFEIQLLASGRSPLALPEPASITALAVAAGLVGRRSRRPNRG